MLLRNLLQNALRHTPDGICIEFAPHGLSITDSGPGIPEHIQRRMSGENGREIPEDGLGLFIVRLICERLGWMLSIYRGTSGGTVIDILFLQSAVHTAE
jgi:signal transduction histidine kinase